MAFIYITSLQMGWENQIWAIISNRHGVLRHQPKLGSHKSPFLTFHNILIPAYEWCRPSKKVCCRQHKFSLCSPSPKLSTDHSPFLVQYLTPSSPFLNPHGTVTWNGCECISGMDKTLNVLLASASSKGRYCLCCWQGILVRPRCTVTCCWIIYQNYFLAFFPFTQTQH